MNQVKKVMVVMLPTENINKNGIQPFKGKHGLMVPCTGAQARKWSHLECHTIEAQHLYLLSDEQINIGDYIYSPIEEVENEDWQVRKVEDILNEESHNIVVLDNENKRQRFSFSYSKKIIASTDETLNLPRPSKAFIQRYCEDGPIDKVNVEYEENCHGVYLPKRAKDNTITIHPVKYQFSREEVTTLVSKVLYDANNVDYSKMDLREKASFLSEWLDNNLN